MELDPCSFFNPLYLVEIFHFMIFNSTCEMESTAHHNIIILKYLNNPFNLNKTNLQLYCH